MTTSAMGAAARFTRSARLAVAILAATAAAVAASGCGQSPVASSPSSSAPQQKGGAAVGGVAFEEVALRSGIRHRWRAQPRPLRILETFGAGCAFLDYDGDGRQDILLVDEPSAVLYRNLGGGRFEDASARTGLKSVRGSWKGCAVGDYDGDGRLDLLLNGYRSLALLRNRGGKWADATREAGLRPDNRGQWGSSAGFMDLDGDGALDLVLGHYVAFGPGEKQHCSFGPEHRSACPPQTYRPEHAEVWQSDGRGRFRDVSGESGVRKGQGITMVLAFADVDGDGRMDFYVGNDATPADLMLNQSRKGRVRLRNIGKSSGLAFGVQPGHEIAAMGADWGDYDADGRLDLAVSAYTNQSYPLFRSLGRGAIEQNSHVTGLAAPTLDALGFGAKWADVDNDGWPELSFANGHVHDKSHMARPPTPFRQPLMLFRNRAGYLGERVFEDIAPRLGGAWARPILGRGLCSGDYDDDGRVDILAVDYEGSPLLLRNVSRTSNHWLTLDLRGAGRNRFAYGAKVVARAKGRLWVAQVSPASSYLSSSDIRPHLGLGPVETLDSLTIRWPSGKETTQRNVAADRVLVIEEGGAAR